MTSVSGTVFDGSGGPWTLAGSPYRVTANVTVPAGETLTVEPGVIVKFNYLANSLIINGTLIADGTPGARIIFTSERDDTAGGDTNGDGSTTPSKGSWGYLRFSESSTGSTLDYVDVRYGGYGTSGEVWVDGGQLTLTHSALLNSSVAGIRIANSNPTLTANTYQNNNGAALSMDLASNPAITDVTVSGNSINGLALSAGTLVGNGVWDDPDIVYHLGADTTVPAGTTLTIAPGQIIKVAYGAFDLLVDGTLLADGSVGSPIIFTDVRDDDAGGDTNNDGTLTNPIPGRWGGIKFRDPSTGNRMAHCEVRYGGWDASGAVQVDHSDLNLSNSRIFRASQHGVRSVGSAPVLADNVFERNAGAAVSMDLGSNPDLHGVTLISNGINGARLDSGTLPGNAFWDDPQIVYYCNGDITVPAGSTLILAPGQIVKMDYGTFDLLVDGTLLADGSAGHPIVFTDVRDDDAGGDTNNDGTLTSPYPGRWGGIIFRSSSTGSRMAYCDVRYGGWDATGAVLVDHSELTLTNSRIFRGSQHGLRSIASAPALTDTEFERNAGAAVSMDLGSAPVIHGAILVNNGINGVRLDSGTLPGSAYWNNPEIVYRLSGDTTVPEGSTLTLAAGQVIKQVYGMYDLNVAGTLHTLGTEAEPTVLTSDRDDTAGGDTNNDGSTTGPYPGIWGGLKIGATSTGNVLHHLIVRYGGWDSAGAVTINGGEVTLNQCTIFKSSAWGLRIENASPVLTGCTVQDCAASAISIDLNSDPTIAGVTLINNGANALRFDSGMLPGDAVWDDTDIVHLITGSLTVPQGSTLTLAAGLIVKVVYGANDLIVAGTLRAQGRPDAPIAFTSERDDTVGGDTNNNGSATGPSPGLWGSLVFTESSEDSVLIAVRLAYGGWGRDAQVLADGGRLTLQDSIVKRGSSSGLKAVNRAQCEVVNCVVASNAWSGLVANDEAIITATNATVHANDYGAYADGGLFWLTNCLISGGRLGGLYTPDGSPMAVAFCDVYNPGSTYGNYRNLLDQTGQQGNLSADPRYVNAAAYDYRLQDGSPAIDAGTHDGAPVKDLLGLLRYDHPDIPNAETGPRGWTDLGAYEYGGLAPLDVDLAVGNVTGPVEGTQNGTVQVTWQVTNAGTDDATRPWYDAVYLSADGTWSQDDRLIGSLQHSGGLLAGAAYNASLDILLQGVIPGSFYFIVVADARAETLEGGPRNNNASSAAATTTFTMDRLALGVPAAGAFAAPDDLRYYEVQVPTGANLLVRLDDADNAGLNELYLSQTTPPVPGSAQYSASGGPDLSLAVPAAPAGNWYVLVRNALGTGAYTLLAEITHLGLHSVAPDTLGNGTEMAVSLSGSGFGPSTIVDLLAAGGTAYPGMVEADSYEHAVAIFAAGTVPAGTYSVRVTDPGSGLQASLTEALTVLDGGSAAFEAHLATPSAVGYHQLATLYVNYRNTGTVAMTAPLVLVTASQTTGGTERRAALLTLDSHRLAQGFWTSAVPDGFAHSVTFLASGATPGRLEPGESGRMSIYYAGWLRPWDFSYPPIRFAMGTATADNAEAADWDAVKEILAPTGVEPAAWDAVWANFAASAGTTWGQFIGRLSGEATRLYRLGRQVPGVNDLMASMLRQAESGGAVGMTASVVDIGRPAPGLPLLLWRLAPNSISCRWHVGPLGRGWFHNWEVSASRENDGTVSIIRHGFMRERYQPDTRGGFLSPPGNAAVLRASGDTLVLTFPGGSCLTFAADGRLATLTDPNHNTVTATYGGDHLTRLSHSAGLSMDLTYTASGRLQSVVDAEGESVTYVYDASGEYLVGADYSDGRSVTYSYAGTGGPAAHVLTRIGLPNGTGLNLGYDAAGRLTGEWRDGQVAHLTYAYPAAGTALVSRGEGTVAASFDDRGFPARLTSATGGLFSAEHDSFGNLTQLTGPDGRSIATRCNARGELTAFTGTLGAMTTLERGPLGRTTAITDARRNTTAYRFDLLGNPLSVAWPDGTTRSYAYDAQGNPILLINRRGSVVHLKYDAMGRPTEVALPATPTASATYTERGAYATVSDRFGTSTFDYDGNGRLQHVALPAGRQFTVTTDDVGRRTALADESGYTMGYTYDGQGRLQAVTNAAGVPFVVYHYDAQGRVVLEQRGNGTAAAYAYTVDGRLERITHTGADSGVLSEIAYEYDAVGLPLRIAGPDGTWTLTYDGGGRLAQANRDGIPPVQITYAYDGAGNCIARSVDGVTENRSANALNQITSSSTTDYVYDADGNLIRATDGARTRTYSYDALNRQVAASTPAGTWTYEYDGFGRRAARATDASRSELVYDPQSANTLLAERDGAGTVTARYIHGLGLVCRVAADGTAHYYDFDRLGSTIGVSDPTGTHYENRYAYLPFGTPLLVTETVANPFLFVGRWGVTAEGSGLYHMGSRDYDPTLGRFVSPDAYGQRAGANLYQYAANSPLRYIDPMGHEAFDEVRISDFTGSGGMTNEILHEGERHLYDTAEVCVQAQERMDPHFDGDSARQEIDRLRRTSDFFEDAWSQWQRLMSYQDDPLSQGLGELRDWLADGVHRIRNFRWCGAEAFYYNTRDSAYLLWDYAVTGDRVSDWDSLIFQLRNEWEWWDEEPVASRDPNAKTGPGGVGGANYMPAGALLPYRIDFENDPEASAPDQWVTIIDPLSADLDWASLELTELGFADTVIAVPPGNRDFAATVSITRLGASLDVQLSVTTNLTTGVLSASFLAVDPATGLPPSADLGFLLPEDGSGRGQGHLSFVVRPRAGLPSGTEIRNVATITFDFGEVIDTNQVDPHDPGAGTDPAKEALVTLDTAAPSSAVAALPALSLPGFLVSWSGTDAGAGIASYTIYVQDNGGPFTPWLTATTLTEEVYAGVAGHTYGFYSIATDAVGWQEAAKTVAESSTAMAYALVFEAGPHGSLTGATTQYVAAGASTTPVTAVPAEGYHFRRWTQGAAEYSLANPLTVDPVTADLALTAEFEINSYTLTYSAGPNGSVTGPTPQTVNHGADGATVTAVPHAGYHFVQWSDGILTAGRTDTHVTAALTVTASFAINQYTLTYGAGPHGSIVGPTPQTVDHGATAAAVTATPDAGFRFVQWSDGVLTAERTDTNVSADLTVTASFAVNQHTLSYSAGPHGSLAGNALQTVPHEGDGTALQALPDEGYVFTQWSDGSTANPRTDTRVIADLVVTAEFSVAGGVAPVGPFLARIGAAGVAAGQGLWDLTGPYATLLGNHELTLNLTHDRRGKLGGTAILRVNTAKGLVPVALPIKGSTRGSGGALLAALRLQGSDAARTVRVALAFDLALNPAARQLHGPVTGSLKVNGVPGAIPDSLTLDLPAGMDGTWTVLFDLEREGSRSLTGTALLTLANGVDYLCIAKGRIAGQGAVLTLSGHPADPPATAIRIRTTIETLEGGQARLRTLSGSVYGQTLGW